MDSLNHLSISHYHLAHVLFLRALASIYFLAFLNVFNEFPALLGEHGLLPVPDYIKRTQFKDRPTLFQWFYSDSLVKSLSVLGMAISLAIIAGIFSTANIYIHLFIWLFLYLTYLSIVNVGQTFYAFGWESMLLEAGFFTGFMGSENTQLSWIPLFAIRWMLFRTEFGAGLIKIRGDKCWRDLTCLYYHYETQPIPNPLSRTFHFLPKFLHRFSVLFSHLVQLVLPFFLFLPQPLAAIGAFFMVAHQLILIVSGNYSWLNWLTITLAIPSFADPFQEAVLARPQSFDFLLIVFFVLIIYLSYRPFLNLFSRQQLMNYCWNSYHLIGAYGAFGSVTKERYEIIIEGTTDEIITSQTKWEEYEFKGKPGRLNQRPPQIAPYHLRLDWLMWFLPFYVQVDIDRIYVSNYQTWFLRFIKKLLNSEPRTLRLLKKLPFTDRAPHYIRAQFYHYKFTIPDEFRESKNYWKKTLKGTYFPPVGLKDF